MTHFKSAPYSDFPRITKNSKKPTAFATKDIIKDSYSFRKK